MKGSTKRITWYGCGETISLKWGQDVYLLFEFPKVKDRSAVCRPITLPSSFYTGDRGDGGLGVKRGKETGSRRRPLSWSQVPHLENNP